MDRLNCVCFICLCDKNIKTVVDKNEAENEIFTKIRYVLPEITILSPDIPLRICITCYKIFLSFYELKKKCLDNYNRLIQNTQIINGTSNIMEQKSNALQINSEPFIKQERNEENKDTFVSSNDQENLEIALKDNINIKYELDIFEDNFFREFYQELKSETFSDCVQDDNPSGSKQILNVPEDNINREFFLQCVGTKTGTDSGIGDSSSNTKQDSNVSDNIDHDFHQQFIKNNSLSESVPNDSSSGSKQILDLYEDIIDPEFYQHFIKNLSVSDCAQDESSNGSKQKLDLSADNINREFYQHFIKNLSASDNLQDDSTNDSSADENQLNFNKNISKEPGLSQNRKLHKGHKKIKCAICLKEFQEGYIKRHVRTQHVNTTKSWECGICKKKFARNSNLKNHMKIHEGIRDLACTICDKKFSDNSNFSRHMKGHKNRKEYKCSICNRKFLRICDFIAHIQLHEGKFQFQCFICNKVFLRNYYFKKHMKLHEDKNYLKCSMCNRNFSSKYYLNNHICFVRHLQRRL